MTPTMSYDLAELRNRELSVAMTGDLDRLLCDHFDHPGRQEDLTFFVWRPSYGHLRTTLVLGEALLPDGDERILDGNVSFTSEYLTRCLARVPEGAGLGLVHSHLGPGWQGMSKDDIAAEQVRLASAVAGRTGLPVLGMTWGTDGSWSARVWGRAERFRYERVDIPVVRVAAADRLALTFHPKLRPAPAPLPAQEATVSVWGAKAQADIARARVGVVGLGSVGSIVAEALSRVGVSDVVLIDHDHIEMRNLDRTLHASRMDADDGTPKVHLAKTAMADSHTAGSQTVAAFDGTLLSAEGLAHALDCDVLICCVDRPWPRSILNVIAYAHALPVIDGGIFARTTEDGRPLHVDWRIHTVGPGRACLYCLGALLRSDVALDRDGKLDDPDYVDGLSRADRERYNRRNVFPFSLSVAAHEVLQLVGMIAASPRIAGVGPQHYEAYPGRMAVAETSCCEPSCDINALTASAVDLQANFTTAPAAKVSIETRRGARGPVARGLGFLGVVVRASATQSIIDSVHRLRFRGRRA